MSAPTRFLVVAVFSWIGIRATAGMIGVESERPLPQTAPMTPLPELAAVGSSSVPMLLPSSQAAGPYGYAQPVGAYPSYGGYPFPASYGPQPRIALPRYAPVYYPYPVYPAALPHAEAPVSRWDGGATGPDLGGFPQAEDAPLSRMAASLPPAGSAPPTFTGKPIGGLDRLSLSSWAFVRQEKPVLDLRGSEPSLATGGTLGGSQAGARLTWRFNRAFAANLRVSAPLQQQQFAGEERRFSGEAALGLSWQPLQSVPVQIMAERRKAIGAAGGGRDAFALLAEGGVYERPLPWAFRLDGYAQSGIVGARTRDWFVDGGVTATRPLYGRFALGAGVWGGAQPGLSRIDVGPRLSMQIRPGIKAHLDYRYRLLGSAEPGSGFAVTAATDF